MVGAEQDGQQPLESWIPSPVQLKFLELFLPQVFAEHMLQYVALYQ